MMIKFLQFSFTQFKDNTVSTGWTRIYLYGFSWIAGDFKTNFHIICSQSKCINILTLWILLYFLFYYIYDLKWFEMIFDMKVYLFHMSFKKELIMK